jgi:hypothetical protein
LAVAALCLLLSPLALAAFEGSASVLPAAGSAVLRPRVRVPAASGGGELLPRISP